jgi:hypothetical protein
MGVKPSILGWRVGGKASWGCSGASSWANYHATSALGKEGVVLSDGSDGSLCKGSSEHRFFDSVSLNWELGNWELN